MRPLAPARTRSLPVRRGNVLAGCLVILGIILILLLVGGIYVYMNWKNWAASISQTVAREVINNSKLPDDQKTAIIAEVDRVSTDFKEGKISFEELRRVGEAIAESPALPLAGVQLAKEKYIEPSDMTPEEKAAANRSLQRFARGIYEKKITPAEEQITDVIKPVVRLKPGNQWEFKEKPTRQELDQFAANCKAKADEAQIPDEPFEINFADELKKVIAQALKEPPPAPSGGAGGG